MIHSVPSPALKMRTLAAQLRVHALETGLELYRRKFEGIALDLEEAAIDAESRIEPFKRAS